MKKFFGSVRFYVFVWGVSSVICGFCFIITSFWRDMAGDWVEIVKLASLWLMGVSYFVGTKKYDAEKAAYCQPLTIQEIASRKRKERFMKGMKLKGGA
jgi:hypothetical protein